MAAIEPAGRPHTNSYRQRDRNEYTGPPSGYPKTKIAILLQKCANIFAQNFAHLFNAKLSTNLLFSRYNEQSAQRDANTARWL